MYEGQKLSRGLADPPHVYRIQSGPARRTQSRTRCAPGLLGIHYHCNCFQTLCCSSLVQTTVCLNGFRPYIASSYLSLRWRNIVRISTVSWTRVSHLLAIPQTKATYISFVRLPADNGKKTHEVHPDTDSPVPSFPTNHAAKPDC